MTSQERKNLKLCEEAIQAGKSSAEKMLDGSGKITDRWAYIGIGEGLFTIYNGRLYREAYTTFDQYCQRSWQMSKANASRFILIYQTVSLALHEPGFTAFWQKTAA